MAKVRSFSKTGTKREAAVTLDKAVFATEVKPDILSLAYRAYLAAGRNAHANVLTRGLVNGGGKKPWRQKGTGRARAGSSRIPHWRGGGVVFGPTGMENYTVEMPTKLKRSAIRMALSVKAEAGAIVALEAFELKDAKTKAASELLGKLDLNRTVLLVVDEKNADIDRATRNLAAVKTVQAKYLNVYDVMNADHIVITDAALQVVSGWLAGPEQSRRGENK